VPIVVLDTLPAVKTHPGEPPPPEYVRAVSTGPLAPLVIAATTAAGVLHAGFSYRTAAFTPETVRAIAANFRERIALIGR